MHSKGKAEKRLRNKFNYVRFFLPELLPSIHKVIYLDTDVIVLVDLALLYDKYLLGPTTIALAACDRSRKPLRRYVNFTSEEVISSGSDLYTGAFNAGVLVMRLDNWQNENVTSKVRYWMEANSKSQLYTHTAVSLRCN